MSRGGTTRLLAALLAGAALAGGALAADSVAWPDGVTALQAVALPNGITAAQSVTRPDGATAAPPVVLPAGVTAAQYLALPAGVFRSALPLDGRTAPAVLAPFFMRSKPVSNAEFRAFVATHPAWQRGQAPGIFAAPDYLSAWNGTLDYTPMASSAPVTHVSWYAAMAFCDAEGARLPRWHEWEYAAAADAGRADARGDPAWLARILAWYSRPGTTPPQQIGLTPPNLYGLHDLHGLVWEWVEDFNGLFVNADSRVQGEQKQLEFCGGAALSLGDRENYAVLIRLAMLAAMEGNQGGAYLGFRCVRDAAQPQAGVRP